MSTAQYTKLGTASAGKILYIDWQYICTNDRDLTIVNSSSTVRMRYFLKEKKYMVDGKASERYV